MYEKYSTLNNKLERWFQNKSVSLVTHYVHKCQNVMSKIIANNYKNTPVSPFYVFTRSKDFELSYSTILNLQLYWCAVTWWTYQVVSIPVMFPSRGSSTSSSQERSHTLASQLGYNFSSMAAIFARTTHFSYTMRPKKHATTERMYFFF